MSSEIPTTEHVFHAALAGTELLWSFRFPETERFLRKWIKAPLDAPTSEAVRVADGEFADWERAGNAIDGFAEFCLLCQQTSEALLPAGRCVFHAAAIRFRDRAWLIAGGSGVGKSTQVRTLLELYPGEIAVINGDKPLLECREDGSVMVHPSPWNGKEGLHGAEAAPLGGIFLLRRGEENAVEPITPQKAAPFLYMQIFQSFGTGETVRRAGEIAEKILNSAPVWLMTNKGVPDSTRLMYETMCQEVKDDAL